MSVYLLFFSISICLVLGYVYFSTLNLLERQDDETVQSHVIGLTNQFRTSDVAGVKESIAQRIDTNREMQFLFTDPKGTYIAGNLQAQPINEMVDNEWVNFTVVPGDLKVHEGHQMRGFNVQLPRDYQLLVAIDVEDLAQFRRVTRNALLSGLGLAIILGVGSGLIAARNLLKRIDAITDSSKTIMKGNLAGRMPINGSGDELDRLSQSLNEMLDQIESLMQGLNEVSSNVAHDLRTPLTRLRARVEAALRQNNKKDYQAALLQTLTESDAMLSTFNALMSLNQLDSGQLRSGLVDLDCYDVLQEVVELYEPLAEERHGQVQLIARRGLVVLGKRELLAQALINLLDNAIKYGQGPDGATRIKVEGQRRGEEVILSLSDNGSGIPAEDGERVLKRFVRLDASRTKPGNGLGLSLVASVANLLGGKLTLSDNKPGLRAELRLPLARAKG